MIKCLTFLLFIVLGIVFSLVEMCLSIPYAARDLGEWLKDQWRLADKDTSGDQQ